MPNRTTSPATPRRTPRGGFAPALGFAALASAGAATWLVYTVLVVLPLRNPDRIGLWSAVAAGLFLFALLSALALRRDPLGDRARLGAAGLAVPAIGLGLGAIARMAAVGGAGGQFEGYVVLLGAIAVVHGFVALAHAFTPRER